MGIKYFFPEFLVFCIKRRNAGVFSFRYLVLTFLHFYGILVSQAKKMGYIGIPLHPWLGMIFTVFFSIMFMTPLSLYIDVKAV